MREVVADPTKYATFLPPSNLATGLIRCFSSSMSNSDKSNSPPLPDQVQLALESLLASAKAWDPFREQAKMFRQKKGLWRDLDENGFATKSWLEMIDSAEAAGALEPAVRFLLRSHVIEQIHDKRCYTGVYKELEDISSRIQAIEEREGVGDLEYWPRGGGPEDWNHLNNRYEKIVDVKFEEALREFGLDDMADLYHTDREAYDAHREQGRLISVAKTPEQEQLSAVQKRFKSEADVCAEIGAHLAAAVMIGAAFEAALLLACLNARDATAEARSRLSKDAKPRGANPKHWRLKELIEIAFGAGWLLDFMVGDVMVDSASLTAMIQRLRNFAHPARHLKSGGPRDFEHAFRDAGMVS